MQNVCLNNFCIDDAQYISAIIKQGEKKLKCAKIIEETRCICISCHITKIVPLICRNKDATQKS